MPNLNILMKVKPLPNTIWDKKWGTIGNILGNTLWTWWEHFQNLIRTTLGTHWEPKNAPPPLSPPKPKWRKLSPLEPSHWLHEISISKMVCHHFQPGLLLIPPLQAGGGTQHIQLICIYMFVCLKWILLYIVESSTFKNFFVMGQSKRPIAK